LLVPAGIAAGWLVGQDERSADAPEAGAVVDALPPVQPARRRTAARVAAARFRRMSSC